MESRFFYCYEGARKTWNKYDVYFSEKFCNYFSDKVKEIMNREAGMKSSFKVGLSLFKEHQGPMYEPGEVSRIHTAISILPEYIGKIDFCWRSKTGKMVHTYDEDFDEDDLECWIEGINATEYWQAIGTEKKQHPFQLKGLPFELKVYGFGMHMGLSIRLSDLSVAEQIRQQLFTEVGKFNDRSEAQGRKYGVVHQISGELGGDRLQIRIDVGSAGVGFVKKLLRLLAKYPVVEEVVIDL